MNKRGLITDMSGEDLLFLTEEFYDKALVGYVQGCGRETVAVYDMDLLTQALMEEGMSEQDVLEIIDYNILGSHLGDKTPMFLTFV